MYIVLLSWKNITILDKRRLENKSILLEKKNVDIIETTFS